MREKNKEISMAVRRSFSLSKPCRRTMLLVTVCLVALCAYLISTIFLGLPQAQAQEQAAQVPLVNLGDSFVTGFSGVREEPDGSEAGDKDAAKLFIDPDGASLRAFDLSNPSAKGPLGQPLAPEFLTITAREIGQVFGIALDDALHPAANIRAPNIYVTATSVYGLPVVGPDKNGDGSPDRLMSGAADARWMDGLFGENGGPGSVWKIDGLTGEVSLFATITHNNKPNSGAGLGNIAFDAKNQQFFVSDRDTGLIHRLDKVGNLVGVFDHGATGRAAIGLKAVPLDANDRIDITSESFRSDDPSTWGLADPKRRVWGLAVPDNRVYYAVAEGPQVWSVGLKHDGSFDASSVRWELDLPDDAAPNEIADIAFTGTGQMILAQRPNATGAEDFGALVEGVPSRVLRYALETPDDVNTKSRWNAMPGEYAIGLTGERRSASGGVAPGYGYGQDGKLDPTSCEATLWATGDGILESPLKTVAAPPGEAKNATGDGLLGMPADKVRPDNVPPTGLYAIDLDGQFPDEKETGHVGDIEIASRCAAEGEAPSDEPGLMPSDAEMPLEPGVAPEAPYPGEPGVAPGPPYSGDQGVMPPGPPGPPAPQEADLTIDKQLTAPCQTGEDCNFEIVITNVGAADYQGPLVVSDRITIPGVTMAAEAPTPWKCQQAGQGMTCTHPTLLIKPGKAMSLPLTLRDPGDPNITSWDNCAALQWLSSGADTKESITAVQAELAALGYYTGTIDGIAGKQTEQAIRDLEKASGVPETGKITPEFLEWLFGQGASTTTDANPGNDGPACASVNTEAQQSEGAGQLQVEKTGLGKCDFNTICTFDIKITNPTNQPIKLTGTAVDSMTRTHDGVALANTVPSGEAPGFCTGEAPAGVVQTPLQCTAEIDLGPNESKTYKIGIKLDDPKLDPTNNANLDPDPNVAFIAAENCIHFQVPGGPFKSCASVTLGTAPAGSFDLAIEKTLKQAAAGAMIEGCVPSQPCSFTIRVTNNGPGDYVGPMIVKDDMPPGWQLVSWSGPTICEQKGNAFSCSMAPQTTLAAGQSEEWTVDLQPAASQSDQIEEVENCAKIDWSGEQVQTVGGSAGDNQANNDGPACVTVKIPPKPPEQPTGAGAWSGPAGKAFDLMITKGPPHGAPGAGAGAGTFYVCEPLKACPFTVTITNIGIDKYEGPISFKDTPKGWAYSGVSSGWSCTPGGDGFTCTGNVSLGPGESTSIALELKPSMPGVPVDPLQGENCVIIDWKGSPGDANKANDGPDCMPVILSVGAPKKPGDPGGPGVPEAVSPDLTVEKRANQSICEPGEECEFNIIIRGTQDFPFKGKFKVSDTPPKGWTFAGGGKHGLWSCKTDKEKFTSCSYDVSKYPNLPPDGFTSSDTLATDIRFKVPSDAEHGTYVNSVWVTFEPPPGGGIAKDYKQAFAQVQVGLRPNMEVSKTFDNAVCTPWEECSFTITVTNSGKGPYTGKLEISDDVEDGRLIVEYVESHPKWDCQIRANSATGKPSRVYCTRPGPFPPGTTEVVARVKASVKVDAKLSELENCANLWLFAPKEDSIEACDKVDIAEETGITIEKSGPFLKTALTPEMTPGPGYQTGDPAKCNSGDICTFLIQVKPQWKGVYVAPLGVQDEMPPDWKVVGYEDKKEWSCSGMGTNVVRCLYNKGQVPVAMSQPIPLLIHAQVPDYSWHATVESDLENCSYIMVQHGAGYKKSTKPKHEHCIEFAVRHKSYKYASNAFAMQASGTENCAPPADCSHYEFTATRTNVPNAAYAGPLSIRVTPPPRSDFPIARISTSAKACPASRWSCTKTGTEFGGIHTCSVARCLIAPGEQVVVRLEGRVVPGMTEPPPSDLKKTGCAVLEWQERPDDIVDTKQRGGKQVRQACHTITVNGNPEPPECHEGQVRQPDGTCSAPTVTCPREEGWKPYPEGTALLPGWKLKKFGTGADVIFCMRREDLTDLRVSTVPKGKCTKGQTCAVETSLSNVGKDSYGGTIEVRGQITPPVSIRGLVPSSDWKCRTLGGGRYSCRGQPGDFAPGATARVDFGLAIPRTFAGTQITHAVQIAWPKGEKDTNPANDSALFSIPIVAQAPPPPPPAVTTPMPEPQPPASPPAAAPAPPTPVLQCIDGFKRGNRCYCRSGWNLLRENQWRYRCIPREVKPPPAPVLQCIDGFKRGNRCYCRTGWNLLRENQWRYRCIPREVKPPPVPKPPVCTGNSVLWQGKCVPCAPGKRANSTHTMCERISQPQPAPQLKMAPLPKLPQIQMIPMQPVCPPNHYWDKNKKKCMARGTIR